MQTDTRERIRVRIAWAYGISIIFLKEAILFLYYHHDFCYVSATSWTKIFVWRPIESDSQSVFAQFREREIQMLLFLVPGVLALLANSRSGQFRRFFKKFFFCSAALNIPVISFSAIENRFSNACAEQTGCWLFGNQLWNSRLYPSQCLRGWQTGQRWW